MQNREMLPTDDITADPPNFVRNFLIPFFVLLRGRDRILERYERRESPPDTK